MSGIKNYFIDSNLLSGSSDTLRTALGGYWHTSSTDYGPALAFDALGGMGTTGDTGRYINKNFIERVITDVAMAVTNSVDSALPSIKIPIRLVGDQTLVTTDEEWRAVLLGSAYGTSSYSPIYQSGPAFSILNFNYETPYSPIYIKEHDYVGLGSYTMAHFTYDYNYYLPEYQEQYRTPGAFQKAPNYYDLVSYRLGFEDLDTVSGYYIGLEDSSAGLDQLFYTATTNYPPAYDIDSSDLTPTDGSKYTFLDKRINTEMYLTGTFGRLPDTADESFNPDSYASTLSNIYFNKEAQHNLFAGALAYKDLMPYCAKLTIPFERDQETIFFDMMEDANFNELLLNHIKEQFVDQKPRSDDSTNYETFTTQISTSDATGELINSTTRQLNSYRSVDLYQIILDTIVNSNNERADNFVIPGGQAAARQKIINQNGIYRYNNSVSALKLLTRLNEFLEQDAIFSSEITQIEDFYDLAQNDRYNEILAYRIEKVEDASNIKQNFYISKDQTSLRSTEERDGFAIYDSQVKYGEPYTYTAYAYVLVYGYEYRYNDLVISKNIATKNIASEYSDLVADLGGDIVEQAAETTAYCLEFYDAVNGGPAERLVYNDGSKYLSDYTSTVTTTEEVEFIIWGGITYNVEDMSALEKLQASGDGAFSTLYTDTVEITTETEMQGIATNPLFTNAQYSSYDKFLADLSITITPTMKLIEVPIFTKSITITDHPPPQLEVHPFHRIDDSNIIGFLITQDTFSPIKHPSSVIQSGDYTLNGANYLLSNDLISSEDVTLPSQSKVSNVEVFRTQRHPKSKTDFTPDELIAIKNLFSPRENYMLPNIIHEDSILTNTEYYYTFRFISENVVIGPQTSVFKIQLVDDGGYKYLKVDELMDTDFEKEDLFAPSEPAKKLLQIVPNIKQIQFDNSNVDYTQPANTQLSNIAVGTRKDTIFDKTFKIRLTSKKTGKRIDLNVTYKLK